MRDRQDSLGHDNRMFVEAMLWIVPTGSPWRDLPEEFGEWNSVFRRFSHKGIWWRSATENVSANFSSDFLLACAMWGTSF